MHLLYALALLLLLLAPNIVTSERQYPNWHFARVRAPIYPPEVSLLQRTVRWDQEQVNHLAWSPDGKLLAIASIVHADVVLRDVLGNIAWTLSGHTAGVRSVAFNRDGALLASASNDGTARVWRVRDGRLQCVVKHTNQVIAVAFNPRRSILASGGDDGVIILTNTSNCATVRRITIGKVVASLAFNSRGTMLASGGQSQVIQLWNPDTGAKIRELMGHTGWVWSLAFNPRNDNLLASAGTGDLTAFQTADNAARLWDVRTGKTLATLPSDSFYMLSVSFNTDGTLLATASRYEHSPSANNVRIWSVPSGKLLRELPDTGSWSNVVAFNPSGTLLAVGIDARNANAGSIELWGIP